MKHVAAFILLLIIFFLVSPIMLIKWNADGFETITAGICEMCGVD